VKSMYDEIVRFMQEYFPAYSQYGQIAETQRVMDRFYAPDVTFDGGMVTGREQWYQACLAHPAVQDKLTLDHLFVDEKQMEAGALLKTQAIDRASGRVLLELRMNVLYNLKIDQNNELKITGARVFLETNPDKVAKLSQLYNIKASHTK
jgi:hypothetical protein